MSFPHKILIIRFSSLGDIIQVSAFAELLRQQYPLAKIDWLTKAVYQDLVESFPAVDRVFGFDAKKDKLAHYCQQLVSEKYDLVYDLHSVWRSMLARRYIGCAKTIVYQKPYFKRWLLFHWHHDKFTPDFHVVGDYCRLIDGDGTKRPLTRMKVPEECVQKAQSILENVKRPLVACVTGAAWPQKRYPVELWQKLLLGLLERREVQIVLIGGPDEREPLLIASALPKERVILANQYSIMDTLAILGQCQTAIGNDTGFMHGAEALGLDVVFLLGPTSRHGGGYPNRPGSFAAEIALPCRPCSQKGDHPCKRRRLDCFYLQSQEGIIDEILKRLP